MPFSYRTDNTANTISGLGKEGDQNNEAGDNNTDLTEAEMKTVPGELYTLTYIQAQCVFGIYK